jgi:uncharacterized membrane protein
MKESRRLTMDWSNIHSILIVIQRFISLSGILIILFGVLYALSQFIFYLASGQINKHESKINAIRLKLGRILILGLEFIVAADLIGTTTTPDYYAVGILAIIVLIRTALSFSLNRELIALSKQ